MKKSDKTERKPEMSKSVNGAPIKPSLRDLDADGKAEGGEEGEKKAFTRPPKTKRK